MSDQREQEDYGYHGDGGRLSNDDDDSTGRGSTVTLDGGTLRVSVRDGGERLKALAARDKARHEAATKTDSRSMVRTQSHSLPPVQATPAAFRITSRSSHARTLPVAEITGESLVHIGSEMVSMAIAESVGLVSRDGAGNISLTEKGKAYGGIDDVPAAPAPKSGPTTPAKAVIANLLKTPDTQDGDATADAITDAATNNAEDAEVARAGQALEGVPRDVVISTMARAVEGSVDVEGLATSLGMTVEEAQAKYSTIESGYEAEATAYLRTQGVADPEGFRAWAEGQRLDEFRGAVEAHLGGNLGGYDTLAATFAKIDAALSQKGALDGFDGTHEIAGETATVWTVKGVAYFDHPTIGKMTLKRAILLGHVERAD